MDNSAHGIRASGEYATHNGRNYLGYPMRDRVLLLSDDDPLPTGFELSSTTWVRGEAIVPMTEVARTFRVRTTATWHGHRFEIGIIVGELANVTYLGVDFDQVCRLPGMERPDKYEVMGTIPVSELSEVEEGEEVSGHPADFAEALRSRMRRGHGLSRPYARKWEVGGCEAIASLRDYPYEGLLVLGKGLSELRFTVFAVADRLIIDSSPRAFWVAANRSIPGDGPPDAYLIGWDAHRSTGYVGDAPEVLVEMLEKMDSGSRRPPVSNELQVGFPGLAASARTYVGSWQWNVHGEATDDEFIERASAATLAAIAAKEARAAGPE